MENLDRDNNDLISPQVTEAPEQKGLYSSAPIQLPEPVTGNTPSPPPPPPTPPPSQSSGE